MSEIKKLSDLDHTLRALVLLTREGDQASYKELLLKLAPLIRRIVRSRIGHGSAQSYVEDITQETLLAIHLKLHTYDISMPFLAWLNVVARHKLIDQLRRIKGGHVSLDDEDAPVLEDPADPEASSTVRDLNKLLGTLKPPAGDLIRKLKIEGMSVRELADTYKLTEGNVKVLVHRGLQKLSQLMATELS